MSVRFPTTAIATNLYEWSLVAADGGTTEVLSPPLGSDVPDTVVDTPSPAPSPPAHPHQRLPHPPPRDSSSKANGDAPPRPPTPTPHASDPARLSAFHPVHRSPPATVFPPALLSAVNVAAAPAPSATPSTMPALSTSAPPHRRSPREPGDTTMLVTGPSSSAPTGPAVTGNRPAPEKGVTIRDLCSFLAGVCPRISRRLGFGTKKSDA